MRNLSSTAWLLHQPNHVITPLLDADDRLVVRTRYVGEPERRVLCRHPQMESAIIDLVDQGLGNPKWEGLLYVMAWEDTNEFEPLFVANAGARGTRQAVSANLLNLDTEKSKFARWGDSLYYYIGDLSQALFADLGHGASSGRYERWIATLFERTDPPQLRKGLALYTLPWWSGNLGPLDTSVPLKKCKAQLIQSLTEDGYCVLNGGSTSSSTK